MPKSNLKIILHVKSDGEVLKLPLILYSADGFVAMNSMEQFWNLRHFIYCRDNLLFFFAL
jgi:hypothetical protein